MLFQAQTEVIVNNREGDIYNGKLVNAKTKGAFKSLLDQAFDLYKKEINPNIVVKTNNINPTPSVMVRSPGTCNILAGRGYKNVLFVGYYDESENKKWVDELDRVITQDSVPFEIRNVSHVGDFNLCYQLIPALHKFYGYDFNMTVLSPPAQRNKGLVDYIYNAFGVSKTPATKQYKFGSESTELKEPLPEDAYKYDAVVFAGVPKKYGDTKFTSEEIKRVWAPYCTPNFEIVDLVYEAEDYDRFSDRHNQKDIEPQVTKAFSARAETDRSVLTGRPIHFEAYKRTMKVF